MNYILCNGKHAFCSSIHTFVRHQVIKNKDILLLKTGLETFIQNDVLLAFQDNVDALFALFHGSWILFHSK